MTTMMMIQQRRRKRNRFLGPPLSSLTQLLLVRPSPRINMHFHPLLYWHIGVFLLFPSFFSPLLVDVSHRNGPIFYHSLSKIPRQFLFAVVAVVVSFTATTTTIITRVDAFGGIGTQAEKDTMQDQGEAIPPDGTEHHQYHDYAIDEYGEYEEDGIDKETMMDEIMDIIAHMTPEEMEEIVTELQGLSAGGEEGDAGTVLGIQQVVATIKSMKAAAAAAFKEEEDAAAAADDATSSEM
jgi:hypothetical protein